MISGLITEKIEGHNSDLHQLDVGLEVWKFFKVWKFFECRDKSPIVIFVHNRLAS